MQIFAGLCLNCAVFGALLRPLELVAVKMPPTVATEVGAMLIQGSSKIWSPGCVNAAEIARQKW